MFKLCEDLIFIIIEKIVSVYTFFISEKVKKTDGVIDKIMHFLEVTIAIPRK